MKTFFLAFAVCLVSASTSFAWSKGGHMVTGSVAYRVLKKTKPEAIPKIVAILKKNPLYTERWKKEIEELKEGDDADELLFMLAAFWADEVRQDKRYYPEGGHEASFHYTNKPFKPEGQPDSVKTEAPAEINIVRAYADWLKKLKEETDDEKKSVALCWLFHLIGDSHQPLHAVSLYTENFQRKDNGRMVGDRGGTWFYVKAKEQSNGTNLHAIWDGMITEKSSYRENRNEVIKLMAQEEHAAEKFADELKVLDMEKWTDESFELAKKVAYTFEGKLIEGGVKMTEPKLLPAGYFKVAEPVGKRRGVLAGYRMAAVFAEAFGG